VTGNERRPFVAPAALLPAAVVLGLLVLVWAATTGPVRMLSDSGRRRVFDTPKPQTSPTGGFTPPTTLREVTRGVKPIADLAWVGDLIAVAVLVGVLVALNLALRWLWARRWRAPDAPEEVEFEVLPEQVARALRDDRAARLAAVDQGTPRNAIVACWLRLEEVLAAAGVPARRSETSSEYVVRALHEIDLDPRPVSRLAALYREARFSEHPVGEDARREARAALEDLHRDLDSLGTRR
jgi:hypothetical protein